MLMILLLWLMFAIFNTILAKDKNRNIVGWFISGILFSFFSTIVLGFLSKIPDEHDKRLREYEISRINEDYIDKAVTKVLNEKEIKKNKIVKKNIQGKSTVEEKNNKKNKKQIEEKINDVKADNKVNYVEDALYNIIKFKCKCGRKNIAFYKKSMIFYYCDCERLYKKESQIYKETEVLDRKVIDANNIILNSASN